MTTLRELQASVEEMRETVQNRYRGAAPLTALLESGKEKDTVKKMSTRAFQKACGRLWNPAGDVSVDWWDQSQVFGHQTKHNVVCKLHTEHNQKHTITTVDHGGDIIML